MNNFWIGFFLGVLILYTVISIRDANNLLKEAKCSRKSVKNIVRDRKKYKILKSLSLDSVVYSNIGQRIGNIFKVIWLIILFIIAVFWCSSLL